MTGRRIKLTLLVTLGVVLGLLVVLPFVIDWNWLRGPAERIATQVLGREVRIGHLEVRPGLTPVIRLRDLSVANTDWGQVQPMARAREIEFSIRLWSIIVPPRVIPHVRLTDADVSLERLSDGRSNWEFGDRGRQGEEEGDTVPAVEVRGLRVDGGKLALRDDKLRIRADAQAQTRNDPRYPTRVEFAGDWRGARFGGVAEAGSVLSLRNSAQPFALKLDMKAGATTLQAEGEITDLATWGHIDVQLMIAGPSLASLYPTLRLALPASPPYRFDGRLTKEGNRYGYGRFSGTVGGSDISGDGELLIQEPRPRLSAQLRSKRVNVADLGPIIGVDAAQAAMSRGRPPQQATPAERRNAPPGRAPKAGSPDAPAKTSTSGPRPAAEAAQHARTVPTSLLVPVWGTPGTAPVPHSPRSWMPPPRPQREAASAEPLPRTPMRATAKAIAASNDDRRQPPQPKGGDAASRGDQPAVTVRVAPREQGAAPRGADDRMLPTADFSGERLAVIDADVTLDIDTLVLPARALSLRDLRSRIQLEDARLRIDPLRFAFAGGEVLGSMKLDGQQRPNAMTLAIDLRRLDLGQLLGPVDKLKQSGGRVGAQLRLTGRGASVADIVGSADGSVTMAMTGGQISHLVLAAASLNGGRLLQLALGGDSPSEIRCAGIALTLDDGLGQLQPLVFDTEHVRIDGEGVVNLKKERYDITLRPQPKKPNILSVRGPVHVQGTFRSVDVSLDSRSLVRAGAAAALALVNPLAALIPLIETGPGENTPCGEVLAPVKGAAAQARNRSDKVPER